MTYEKCKYLDECKYADRDSICCTFLNKICRFGSHYKKMEDLVRCNLSPKGIEGCLSDGELFRLSQENKGNLSVEDKGFQEDYY